MPLLCHLVLILRTGYDSFMQWTNFGEEKIYFYFQFSAATCSQA
jgi:hypothetical protein